MRIARRVIDLALAVTLTGWALTAARVFAHTLPISYLTVVPGEDHVHLELILNPFELSSFAELDRNHSGTLESAELSSQESALIALLLQHLKLSVGGKIVAADVAGLTQDLESHHLALRAHFPGQARSLPIMIESTLHAVTSGSHISQITYGHGARRRAARLDMATNRASFEPLEPAAPNKAPHDISSAMAALLWAAFVLPGLVVVLGLMWSLHREFHPKRHA